MTALEECIAAFRHIAPALHRWELEAMRRGLSENDPRLIRRYITWPRAVLCNLDTPAEGACLLGYPALEPGATVGAVSTHFGEVCSRLRRPGSDPVALLEGWDHLPPEVVRPALLAEVEAELLRRG
jgi:hypothetical protein